MPHRCCWPPLPPLRRFGWALMWALCAHGSLWSNDVVVGNFPRAWCSRHLRWEGGVAVLRGKLDGKDRVAKQAADVVTPGHPHHNPRARAAMRRISSRSRGFLR